MPYKDPAEANAAHQRWRERNPEKNRAAKKRWYEANKDRYAEYARTYRQSHPEKRNELAKKYYWDNVEKYAEDAKQYNLANPERRRAGNAVNYEISAGRITPQPCFICGKKAEAHHASYAPDMHLCVTWLCRVHHKQLHVQFTQSIER